MSMSLENLDINNAVPYACQFVDLHRWKTPFTAVSWSYTCKVKEKHPKSRSSFLYARPPHYHHSLFHISNSYHDSSSSDPSLETEADDLNPDLVGVKVAGDALRKYENDVGFYYAEQSNLPPDLVSKSPPSSQGYLCGEVDDEEVMLSRERWHDLVRGLTYGVLNSDSSPVSSTGLHRSTSTLSSIDLSDSERSVISNSMPSTPKPKTTYAHVIQSPTSQEGDNLYHYHCATTRLSASASSFIPTLMSPEKAPCLSPSPSTGSIGSPSPTFTDFSFPSLNSSATSSQSQFPPSVALEKDEHGSYKDVVSSLFRGTAGSSQRRPARLQPFLPDPPRQRKFVSKTRSIIDGLRNAGALAYRSKSADQVPGPNPPESVFNGLYLDFSKPRLSVSEDGGDSRPVPTSVAEEDDGWIRPEMSEADSETKAQRTRDLCLVLGRNRDESEDRDNDIDLGYQFLNEQSAIFSQLSSSVALADPEVTYKDGWIEGHSPSASRPRKPRSGNRSASMSLSSQTTAIPPKPKPRFTAAPFIPVPVSVQSTPYFPVPAMYPTYAHPYVATAGYAQMQMHIQSQLQLQMQMQAQSHHPWFQHVAYPVPLVPVPIHTAAPRFMNSYVNHVRTSGSDRPIVTGVSGLRHAG